MTTRFSKRLICLTLLLGLSGCFSLARSQVSTGSILGVVTDPAGALVSGANVTVTNAGTSDIRTVTTNADGLFTAPDLPAGRYSISVSAGGFAREVASDVMLDVAAQLQVNFRLKLGSTNENVTVSSSVSTLELANSTTMPVVDEQAVVQLPLNGRDWAALSNLQPGVAAVRTQSVVSISNQRANRGVGNQLTVSGARPQMNNYRIDGISINDYSNGGPGGVIGSNLGVDAIQEFSVVTGNATADYGKTAGGVVNAITRTGGNTLHGDVYEFLRNSALDARNEFDLPNQIAPFRRNQFGASAGGPIVRDRAFIFGDYEGLRQFQSTNASSIVPSPNARNGQLVGGPVTVSPAVAPYLQFFPLPNSTITGDTGIFLFNDPATTDENFFTIRADDKLSARDRLAATYLFDRGSLEAPDAFNVKVAGNLDTRNMASVSETHIFTPNLLNTAHFGYSRVFSDAPTTLNAILPAAGDTSLGFVAGLPVGLIDIGGLTDFAGGLHAVGEYVFHYNSYQVYDDLYWNHGKHSIKSGFAFERLQNNQLGTSNPNGQFNFGSLAGFLTNEPTSFNAPLGQTTSPKDLRQSVYGAYVTDDYHFRPNLTFNLGIRYELATVPTETAGRLSNLPTLTSPTPSLGSPYFSNSTEKGFQPRIGLAWSPFGDGKTAVHAAYGIYDSLPLNYLFEGLTILSAPFFESGSVSNGLAGTFPRNAYPLLTPATFRYGYTPQHPQRSYVQQYTLNVQHEFPFKTTAQLGYYGSHGTHLAYREDDINTVQPIAGGGPYEFPSLSNNIGASTTNPRLNPYVGQISAMIPEGFSLYNSLQAGVTKRLTTRFQLQASYTWAKSIDDGSSSTFGDTFANSVSSLPYFARPLRIGVSDFNIKNNFVVNYLLLLPDAPDSFGAAGWALNGWQYGGIFQVSSGLPITPLISGDPLGLRSSDTFDFPNRNYSCNPVNKQNKIQYLNPACFSYPAESSTYNPFLGDSSRNSVIGPGLQEFDMSFVKNNPVKKFGDQFNVQFRAELFNIFNRVNYANPLKAATQLFSAAPAPSAAVPTPALVGAPIASAGALTATATSSRQTQFALKVVF
jgi:Carboxypeptidase regulatory-like domain/TonB-dependent Receptor Plug Domain